MAQADYVTRALHPSETEEQREAMNDTLRFALNELRALDQEATGESIYGDQATCAKRLRALADWIEAGHTPPDANEIIAEASRITIQR